MVKKIKANLPIGLRIYYKRYKRLQKYRINIPELKILNHSFVTYYGLVLKNLILKRESAHNLFSFYYPSFFLKFYKKALETYLVCKYGKSLNFLNLNDNDGYLLIHTPWMNYYMWITMAVPRLLLSEKYHNKAFLIYPEDWKNQKYINETLNIMGVTKKKVIPHYHHLFISKLILPESKNFTTSFDPGVVSQVRDYFYRKLDESKLSQSPYKKIFVERRKAKYRKILNQTDINKILKNNGFKIIDFEDFSLLQQVALMRDAEMVICTHGAGMANANFMRKDTSILELIHNFEDKKMERFSSWRLCDAAGLKYFVQFCEIQPNDSPQKVNYDLIVDKNKLISFLGETINN